MKQVAILLFILLSGLGLYLGYSERFAYFNGIVAESAGLDQKALELFDKGCEQGNPVSCVKIGEKYESGIGSIQDSSKAIEFYEKASSLGYIPAQTKLKELKENN